MLYNIADQLFALKKVTIRLLFFQIKAGYGQEVSEKLWASDAPCDKVLGILPEISLQEWLGYFTAAYNEMKHGTNAKARTRGLTNIALLELGSPLGFYLPLSQNDTLPIARQKIKMYFTLWDANHDQRIDLCEFETQKQRGPMQLSVQKLIVCLIANETLPGNLFQSIAQGPIEANAACGGASLTEAWRYLRDSGTPVESCVGYTFQDWGTEPTDSSVQQSQAVLPMCKELMGPEQNMCPGFVPQKEWDNLVNLIVTGKEKLQGEGPVQQVTDLQALSQKLSTMEPWNQPLLIMFRALNAYSVAPEVEQIQIEILQNGPVCTGFTVYHDFIASFGSFTGGLGGQRFDGSSVVGSTPNSLIYKWDGRSQSTGTAHAVVLIGWGNFRSVPFWIVRNSWGPDWGTAGDVHGFQGQPSLLKGGGYFWFFRGSNDCGVESNVVAGLPDLVGDAFPGTVVQPREQNNLADVLDMKPGYNCVYQKNELVCQTLGFHGSSADYEEIDKALVPIDVTSPLAFFWPKTPEANNKRQALYREIQSYLRKSTLVSSLKSEFDTLFVKGSTDKALSLLLKNGGSTPTQPVLAPPENQLFVGLIVTLAGLIIFAGFFGVLFFQKKKTLVLQ
jgi:cathepsin B